MFIVEKVITFRVRNEKTYKIVVDELSSELLAEKVCSAMNKELTPTP